MFTYKLRAECDFDLKIFQEILNKYKMQLELFDLDRTIQLDEYNYKKNFIIIKKLINKEKYGKITKGAYFFHVTALSALHPLIRDWVNKALTTAPEDYLFNIVKLNTIKPQISLLNYPDFNACAHPELHESCIINLESCKITITNFKDRSNPPILHRKETFVLPNYPGYSKFCHLTQEEEKLGLLHNKNRIGLKRGWIEWLSENELEIVDHFIKFF